MKLRYRILFKCKWCLRLKHWYRMKFHRERTLRNFRAFLNEIEDSKYYDD